jgi:hypothetical protein
MTRLTKRHYINPCSPTLPQFPDAPARDLDPLTKARTPADSCHFSTVCRQWETSYGSSLAIGGCFTRRHRNLTLSFLLRVSQTVLIHWGSSRCASDDVWFVESQWSRLLTRSHPGGNCVICEGDLSCASLFDRWICRWCRDVARDR